MPNNVKHEYYIKNRDRILARQKKYDVLHAASRILYQKIYHKNRLIHNRVKHNEYTRKYNLMVRKVLFQLLGDRCSNKSCLVSNGCTDIRCLQIDHINGGGGKEIKKYGTIGMYRYYIKHPEEAKQKLQILCANCNWIKRYESVEL